MQQRTHKTLRNRILRICLANVEEEQATATETASGSIREGESLLKEKGQSRKDSVKNEVATPKLEPTAKEELDEQDADGQDADTLREELPNREEVPPPDSEDSLGPERVADELGRLTEANAQMTGSTQFMILEEEPQLQMQVGIHMAHMPLKEQEGIEVEHCPQIHLCFILLFGWNMIRKQVRVRVKNP